MKNPFDIGFYEAQELRAMGLGAVGEGVRIAKNCLIVGDLSKISLGNHTRIDAFTSLIATGPLTLGAQVHVASYCHLSAGDGITLEDFSGLSQGVQLYSRTDDYSGEWMTNPTVPGEYTRIIAGPVVVGRHAILGANTVVLPGVTVGEGCSIGAQSLVKESLAPWGMYAGCPVRRIRERSRALLKHEAAFHDTNKH